MADTKSSFWTPARIGAVIGAVLLVVALAYLVSLPQNKYHPCDLLEPTYAAELADLVSVWRPEPDTVEEARL